MNYNILKARLYSIIILFMIMKHQKKHTFFRAVIIPVIALMMFVTSCHSGRIDTSKDSINAKTYRSNDMRDERAAESTRPAGETEAGESESDSAETETGDGKSDAEPEQ